MKKGLLAVLLLCLPAALLYGCKGSGEKGTEPVYPEKMEAADYEKAVRYRQENQPEDNFLEGQNNFAYKTAQVLLEGSEKDFIYSPVSLYYALALAAAGTGGETAAQLYDFLGTGDRAMVLSQAGKLYRTLYQDAKESKTLIASSLWSDDSLVLKEAFLQQASQQLYASVYPVDFTKEEETTARLNSWVQKHTNGTIAPDIKTAPEQVMSILSTIYFYDEWTERFRKADTKQDLFFPEEGEPVAADFMNRIYSSHGFSKGENYTRSFLNLKNTSMFFVLPDEGTSLQELLASKETLEEAFTGGEYHMGEVVFKLPKFTADGSLHVKDMMKSFGVEKLFLTGDFSNMTDAEAVYVSQISQSSHISVNEEGVEASAYTELQYCGAALPDGRADMILDRPFLYGIQKQGVWLFIGVCQNLENMEN